jgi:anti-sigma-K factor RskA
MTCEELRPDYAAFAMGALADPENAELREHLQRGCPACTAGVREERVTVFALGTSAMGAEPPRGLRRRILASVAPVPEPRWQWKTAWLAAAATAMLSLVFFVVNRRQEAEIAQLQRAMARQGLEAASYREALDLLKSPETRQVTFGEGKPEPPKGRVFVNPSSGVLLIASHLPAPPPGKTYEMWIIPKAGNPAPAGLFASGGDETAVHFFRTAVPPGTTGAIAVTLENAGGVDAPTSTPLIVAAL